MIEKLTDDDRRALKHMFGRAYEMQTAEKALRIIDEQANQLAAALEVLRVLRGLTTAGGEARRMVDEQLSRQEPK